MKVFKIGFLTLSALLITSSAFARDLEYTNNEVAVYVTPGEPTQIEFPEKVEGGYKPSNSAINLEKKGNSLIVFGKTDLQANGEAFIVTVKGGRSYSMRVRPSDEQNPRDTVVRITDNAELSDAYQEEELPRFKDKVTGFAPSSTVSGLMREMILVTEFGKDKIPGYRVSDKHSGEVVLNDGTMLATIDKIYIGTELWGYVLNTSNQLDTTQQLNPATFRVDGTRAVMAERWELAPRPMNVEEQVAGKDKAKVYVVTRAK